MLRTKERIKEIKNTALKNLKTADNWGQSRKEIDKERYWSLYRADVRELLGIIEDYELFIKVKSKKTLPELQAEIAQLMKEKDNEEP